jgi:hypothetical protein
MKNLPARYRGLLVCNLGYLLGLAGLASADDADTAEAFTVLGAALASVGGAEIGHGAAGGPGEGHRHNGFHLALLVSTLLATGLALWGALVRDRTMAALTLILAAWAVLLVHHGHEFFVRRLKVLAEKALADKALAGSALAAERLGWVFVAGAVLCGGIGVLAWPEEADIAATFAAALVTAGGTLVGHARGNQRASQQGGSGTGAAKVRPKEGG